MHLCAETSGQRPARDRAVLTLLSLTAGHPRPGAAKGTGNGAVRGQGHRQPPSWPRKEKQNTRDTRRRQSSAPRRLQEGTINTGRQRGNSTEPALVPEQAGPIPSTPWARRPQAPPLKAEFTPTRTTTACLVRGLHVWLVVYEQHFIRQMKPRNLHECCSLTELCH